MLLLPLLLTCWTVAGEDRLVVYYRRRNSSVCFHVGSPPPYNQARWDINEKFLVSALDSNPHYKDKITFSPGNLTLCIKDLSTSESASYHVSFYDNEYNKVSELHQVIVEDVVPPPVLSVHATNQSGGLCVTTVNCSVRDHWLASTCSADGCAPPRASFATVNISVFAEQTAVVCRGNNHVSARNVSRHMATCSPEDDGEEAEEPRLALTALTLPAVLSVAACLALCPVMVVFKRCCGPKVKAAQVIQSRQEDTPPPPAAHRPSTSSSCQAEPAYVNMDVEEPDGTGQEPVRPGGTPGPGQEPESLESPTVDSIYSFPQVAALPGHPPPPQGGAQAETHAAAEVDTVYCLLQMPAK